MIDFYEGWKGNDSHTSYQKNKIKCQAEIQIYRNNVKKAINKTDTGKIILILTW